MADNRLKIVIDVDSATGEAKIRQFGQTTAQAGSNSAKGFEKTSNSLDKVKNRLDSVKNLAVKVGAAMAIAAAYMAWRKLSGAIEEYIALSNEQIAVETRLAAVLKSTEQAAGYNIEQLKGMAAEMQTLTTVGDEVTLAGMAILATFKKIQGEGFERATASALDMSEVMQTDLKSSIVMIGKALNDPIANLSAMSRSGVQFTEIQKDMIKTLWEAGDAAGAQNIILTELESQFGGAAAAAKETFGGAMKSAGNALGDFKEGLGDVITKNEFFIDLAHQAEEVFKGWIEYLKENQGVLENTAVNIAKIALETGKLAGWLAQVLYYSSGIGAGVWLSEFWDGTRKARQETEELIKQLERQKKLVESHPNYTEPGKGAADIYADQWEAAYQAKLKAFIKHENELTKLEAEAEKDRKKLLKSWLDVEREIGKSSTEIQMMHLTDQYDAYKTVVEDKIELEKWWAAEKALIEAGAADASIALYKELYEATGLDEYAEKAITAYEKILDKNQQHWTQILGNEDDALILRLRKEEEFARSLYSIFDKIVDADRNAADERVRITEDMTDRMVAEEERAQSQRWSAAEMARDPHMRGVGIAPGTVIRVYNQSYISPEAARNLDNIARETQRAAESAARAVELAQESAAREQRQIYEQSVRALEGGYGQYTGFIQQRERRAWGYSEYSAELARIMEEYQNAEYFEESLDLLGDMVSTLQTLEAIQQSALAEYRSQTNILQDTFGSIGDAISGLGFGELAPVMSAAMYGGKYAELLSAAKTEGEPAVIAAAVQDFVSYVPEFLRFMGDYGGKYADVHQAVIDDLRLLQVDIGADVIRRSITAGDLFEIIPTDILATDLINFDMAALDIAIDTGDIPGATTIIQGLINKLGIDMPAAASLATGTPGTLSGLVGLTDSLVNTQNPMAETSTSLAIMTGNVQEQLAVVGGFFDTLAASMGLTFGTAGAAGTAIGKLTPPPVTTIVPSGPQYSYLPHTETAIAIYEGSGYGTTLKGYYTPSGYKASAPGELTWYEKVPNWGAGGLTPGISIAGEIGPEWVVPTYEPQRSNFLKDVGADPEEIAAAIARNIAPMIMAGNSGGPGGNINVKVVIDGREIGAAVAAQIDQGNPELVSQIRRMQ